MEIVEIYNLVPKFFLLNIPNNVVDQIFRFEKLFMTEQDKKIDQILLKSILKASNGDHDMTKQLYENIPLSGGGSMV